MAKTSKASTQVEASNGKNPVFKMARTVLLATMGSVALGKEEIETIVNRLVEKGELAEKDGRDLIAEVIARRKKEIGKVDLKVGNRDQRLESILGRMNVPSKRDVENLSRKIGTLSKKVDALNKKIAS